MSTSFMIKNQLFSIFELRGISSFPFFFFFFISMRSIINVSINIFIKVFHLVQVNYNLSNFIWIRRLWMMITIYVLIYQFFCFI